MLQRLHNAAALGALIFFLQHAALGIAPVQGAEVFERDGLTLGLGLEVGAGYFDTRNTNFGLGRIDLQTGEISGDAQWLEGYVEPSIEAAYEADDAATFYGAASAIGALTRWDGDAGGFTSGDEEVSTPNISMPAGARARSSPMGSARTRWTSRSAPRTSRSVTAF
jgi:hypothetical protein